MRFREQRGGLDESMQTCVVLKDKAALVRHCQKLFDRYPVPLPSVSEHLRIELYMDRPDTRIGWDKTYLVTIDGYGVMGMTDTDGTDGDGG